MPTNRHPIRHPRRGRLNHERAMVLQYGPDPRWDAFRDEEEYREAWARHRERLLAGDRHGRRPMAWWRFEAPPSLKYPGYDRERSVLYEAGLLGEEERRELVAEWRQAFERAQAPDFWFCLGPGRSLEGATARRQHYKWADIPRSLRLRWTRERRRRSKAIRQLVETAAARCPLPAA
jgi:hypothetical protein